ncbi:hypothetical protein HMPREF9080_01336 [Cardiobacterium valvarum F0432]|uniref:Uncharacterized protein n=1 Tax=Cardiobacterium valvarum F0432 TaxID=797473 RepID=G9ZEZ7_9GAMM|nr:hypothetical protein HMPREF9080_01336 [Cardiobacterium valvarum F0432]
MVVLAAAVQRVRKGGRQGDDFVALVVVGDHFGGSGRDGAVAARHAVLQGVGGVTQVVHAHGDVEGVVQKGFAAIVAGQVAHDEPRAEAVSFCRAEGMQQLDACLVQQGDEAVVAEVAAVVDVADADGEAAGMIGGKGCGHGWGWTTSLRR